MYAVLLAAGYATRLYPLTKDRPKPLLPVGGRPIIDYLVDRLDAAPEITRMVLVTNARFRAAFQEWSAGRRTRAPIEVLDDGSTCNEDRLGAVADFRLAVQHADAPGESAYVLATDNLPRFDLLDIIGFSAERGSSAVFACRTNPERLKRVGVALLDGEGRIVDFEEKPERPKSDLRVPPFYVYTPQAVRLVSGFLDEGNNPDAPGHFLSWLCAREPVYALRRAEGTYDIGTLATYHAVCAEFGAGGHGTEGPGRR